jgi:hypothetical protein
MQVEGVWEHGAEESIWTCTRGDKRRLEENEKPQDKLKYKNVKVNKEII